MKGDNVEYGIAEDSCVVYAQETYEDGVEYEGIVKVARMWPHYDGMR